MQKSVKDMALNQRISEIINHLGMTQTAFAKTLGTTTSRITNITQGRNKPDSQLLAAIAETYPQINLAWLLTGQEAIDRNLNNIDINKTEDYTHSAAHEAVKNPYQNPTQTHNTSPKAGRKKKTVESFLPYLLDPENEARAAEGAKVIMDSWQRPSHEEQQKALQNYQNKLNHELRREDRELFELKDELEYLSWCFEDARRIMEELEISYKILAFTEGKKDGIMTYSVFKIMAINELKRRLKYRDIIKEFGQTVGEFTVELSTDKLHEDWMQSVNGNEEDEAEATE